MTNLPLGGFTSEIGKSVDNIDNRKCKWWIRLLLILVGAGCFYVGVLIGRILRSLLS